MTPTYRLSAALLAVSVLGLATAPAMFADTKSIPLTGFKRVSVAAGVEVVLRQGAFAVTASGSQKDIERLSVEKSGDTLRISRKSSMNWFSGGSDLKVTVTAPAFEELDASSGSEIDGESLKFDTLAVSVSSGADVEITGICKTLQVNVSSGADFDGSALKCDAVSADASSGADADVWANATAALSASSGADVTVHGKPATVAEDESSGGSVNRK